ncbi:hypothetical protein [Burkholderia cenocepacia]|uniref:hypothetical protein n=1 Tax=Burkholderia cenocepacia TaxID=95486 RepID=UPI002ABE8B7E|nr:hypothetical protein [Burkholderia cenocepacia]
MQEPIFEYYVVHRETLYMIAGFRSALDADRFARLYPEYTTITRATWFDHIAARREAQS